MLLPSTAWTVTKEDKPDFMAVLYYLFAKVVKKECQLTTINLVSSELCIVVVSLLCQGFSIGWVWNWTPPRNPSTLLTCTVLGEKDILK